MAAPVTASRPETATGPFRRDDLEWFLDDGDRYELLDGRILVSPAPRISHQTVVDDLLALFRPLTGRATVAAGHTSGVTSYASNTTGVTSTTRVAV